MTSLYHLIPGYSLYDMYGTVRSDEPFEDKVRSATMAGLVTGAHFLNATHHGLKIQALTLSSPAGLTRSWARIATIASSPVSVPVVTAVLTVPIETVLLSEIVESDVPTADKIRMLQGVSYY